MKNLLEYEQQIVSDVFNESCLLVMCEGLGLDRIMLHFLHLYSDMNEFVFVLNTSYIQQDYYIEQLRLSGVNQPPRAITSESTVVERKKMYANGGIFFASSRILVMDLLMDRIPIHLISGLIVNKAHKVATMCQEQFIMRLYRQKNRDGFIKAFTDNPVSLVGGYGKLPRVMKALYVGKVFLWPRFHSSVAACLEKHKPEVVELCIKMTSSMKLIQTALLEIVNACLRELKENNPQIESDELTLENSLGKSFDRSVRVQLDPIWNQLGSKTKRLVSDLRLLRLLLQALSQYDCVTFLKLLESSMSTPKSFGKNPGWIFLDASNNLFTYARNRVYGDQSNIYTEKKEKTTAPVLEISPKWEALKEILNEITEVNEKTSAEKLGQGKVLICVSDVREIYLIRDILQSGYRPTLMCLYNKMIGKTNSVSTSAVGCTDSAFSALGPNVADKSGKTTNLSSKAGRDKDERKYFSMKVLDHPETHLHTLHGNPDHYSLTRSLEDIKPRYVIMYDSSIHFIRQLEVYKACHAGFPLRVYFLMYESSAEEQIYLTALRKEKEAFHSLIQGKSTMVVPKEREGNTIEDKSLGMELKSPHFAALDVRKAGNKTEAVVQRVIVDMREFRSDLPSLLHKNYIQIEPMTIEVGDYILTPHICVERKSLNDLIGSFTSGRLYKQCVAMCRHYKQPVLLIEFDPSKAFSFRARGVAGSMMSAKELNEKLTLLLMHFSKLCLAWCSSPSESAQLFYDLKQSNEQPCPVKAAAITVAEGDTASAEQIYNSAPYDFLLKLPGVDEKNCRHILHNVKDIEELCNLTESQLASVVGSKQNAEKLHSFLHKKWDGEISASSDNAVRTTSKRLFSSRSNITKRIKTKK